MFRKLIMGRSAKESRAMAERERAERAARQIRLTCAHPCASCDYYTMAYEMSRSVAFHLDCSDVKAEHVWACREGRPNSSSCDGATLPTRCTCHPPSDVQLEYRVSEG